MRHLGVAVVVIGLLAVAESADAQVAWGFRCEPRTYNYAPWQQHARTPYWTDRVYCNPCQSQVYERCVPYCYEQTRVVESDGLQADVNRLKNQVEILKTKVWALEKKVAPSGNR